MHQDEMARFKSMVLPMFLAEAEGGKRDLLSATLGPQATIEDLRATSAEAFYRAFVRAMVAQTGLGKVQVQKGTVLGSVPEGELVHVLARVQVGAGAASLTQIEVISLKRAGDTWRLMLTPQVEGIAQVMRARSARP